MDRNFIIRNRDIYVYSEIRGYVNHDNQELFHIMCIHYLTLRKIHLLKTLIRPTVFYGE